MDKATTEAMRAVVRGCMDRIEISKQFECSMVTLGNTKTPTNVFCDGVEGLQKLVDQAEAETEGWKVAEGDDATKQMRAVAYALGRAVESTGEHADSRVVIQGKLYSYAMYASNARKAARAIQALLAAMPTTTAEPDGRDVLTRFVEDLEDAVASNYRNDYEAVSIFASGCHRTWRLKDVRSIVGAINGLMDAKPTTTGEPTDEECLAAINRNKHKGSDQWKMVVKKHVYLTGVQTLDEDEFTGLGRLLIDRERAKAAKGGDQ